MNFEELDPTAIHCITVLAGVIEQKVRHTYGKDFSDWLAMEIFKQAYEDYKRLYT